MLDVGNLMSQNYIIFDIYDKNGHSTKTISFNELPISVGRHEDSTLYIEGTYVSSRHGLIYLDSNDLIYEDFSKNGTYIQGIAIHKSPFKSIKINEGDEIILAGNYPGRYEDFPFIKIQHIEIQHMQTKNVKTTNLFQDYIDLLFSPVYSTSKNNTYIIKNSENQPIQISDNEIIFNLKKLGSGGTASVYEYQINGECKAVKIYHNDIMAKYYQEYQQKLEAMLHSKPNSMLINIGGQDYTQFAWPEKLVYHSGKLCGYIMQSLPKSNLCQLNSYIRDIKNLSNQNHFSIAYRIQVARNLAVAVYNLHKAGHYFIDVKPENIFVFLDKCAVCFIDCDGFSINQGKFPAKHYSKGYQAPFVLQNNLKPSELSSEPYQDYYCLSHLIFEILDFGNQPFRSIIKNDQLLDEIESFGGESTYDYKVKNGWYPYHSIQEKNGLSPMPKSLFQGWPTRIRQLFDLAFLGEKYVIPTAKEWATELDTHIQNQNFTRCHVHPDNPIHHHFKDVNCPICRLGGIGGNENQLLHNPKIRS